MYVTDSLAQIVDGLIISNGIGTTALAAYGLSDPTFKIILLVSGVLALGMQLSCTEAMTTGNRKQCEKVFSNGYTITLIAATVLTIGFFVFLSPLANLCGATQEDGEVFIMLCDYLRGWFIGIPGCIIYWVLSPITVLDGHKRTVMFCTVLKSIINIVGNFLSVTVLPFEIWGIGFFTGLSWDICSIILIFGFIDKRSNFSLKLSVPEISILSRIVKMGTPKLASYVCRVLAPVLINRIIMRVGGPIAMSAIAIETQFMSVALVVTSSVGDSFGLMAQVFSSERDRDSLRQAAKCSFLLLYVLGFVVCVLFFLLATPIVGMYVRSDSLEYKYSVLAIRCLSVAICFKGTNQLIYSYLQGARKTFFSSMHIIGATLVSPVISNYVLSMIFGVNGLFWAIPMEEILMILLCYLITRWLNRKYERNGDLLDSLLMISPTSFPEITDSMEFFVEDIEQVAEVSRKLGKFLADKEIEHRREMFVSLCAEELTANIIEHGFTKDKKKHYCSIRMIVEGSDIMLRIRDDCTYFDLCKRYESLNNRDNLSGIGLSLINNIAKEITYINILNTNTVYIRI